MKCFFKKYLMMFILPLLAGCLMSSMCSSDDDFSLTDTAQLVGKWESNEIDYKLGNTQYPQKTKSTLEFTKDKVKFTCDGETQTFSYSYDEKNRRIYDTANTKYYMQVDSYSGNTMTLDVSVCLNGYMNAELKKAFDTIYGGNTFSIKMTFAKK